VAKSCRLRRLLAPRDPQRQLSGPDRARERPWGPVSPSSAEPLGGKPGRAHARVHPLRSPPRAHGPPSLPQHRAGSRPDLRFAEPDRARDPLLPDPGPLLRERGQAAPPVLPARFRPELGFAMEKRGRAVVHPEHVEADVAGGSGAVRHSAAVLGDDGSLVLPLAAFDSAHDALSGPDPDPFGSRAWHRSGSAGLWDRPVAHPEWSVDPSRAADHRADGPALPLRASPVSGDPQL